MGRSSKPVNSDAIDSSISELQKELSLLRAENRKLHRALADESLRHEACEELINLAESTYHIKVRKKLRCQVIDTLSQRYSSRRKRGCIKFLCDYFGITRQGYYKHVTDIWRLISLPQASCCTAKNCWNSCPKLVCASYTPAA